MTKKHNPAPVTIWLFTCCAMIFAMAVIGAITRLTQSGLSITSWDPIMGALPPLNDAEWNKAFAGYQQIPQYRILNQGMTLDAFKGIFFWEWLHRLWGRVIGIVFLVPLLVFVARRMITRATGVKFGLIFVLGGLQGFIGWFMVQSGLEVRTSVSPYRLALHLGFALAIYAILLWTACEGMQGERKPVAVSRSLRRHGWVALGLLAVTMCWGAFTAGLHAGEVYNTWPLMDGDWVPQGVTTVQPVWLNFFENTGLVQFVHRWLGPATMLVLLGWVVRGWRMAGAERKAGLVALAGMACLQVALGIGTVMSHAAIVIAVIHQAGAITLLSLLLFNLQRFCENSTDHK